MRTIELRRKGMVVIKTGEKIMIKGKCRRRTGETKDEDNKKMEKTKKEDISNSRKKKKNIYIFTSAYVFI